jgi:hypothetical protein
VAVRLTTIDSIAVIPIVRTDLDKEVSFIVVGSKGFSGLVESSLCLALDQSTK